MHKISQKVSKIFAWGLKILIFKQLFPPKGYSFPIKVSNLKNYCNSFSFHSKGHDTTSTTLSWTLYEIGRSTTVQQKLYDEIMEAKSIHSSLPDQIRSLKYMECVVKEALRLHPPVGGIWREIECDSIVNNHMFPKGKFPCLVNLYKLILSEFKKLWWLPKVNLSACTRHRNIINFDWSPDSNE